MMDPNERQAEREAMVQEQIASRNIRDQRLLEAMRRIPRHHFIPPATDAWFRAYSDTAQPIGEGQTISQPYIVALMTDSLQLQGTEKALEVGAGSGYQTAILSELAAEVVAVERIPELAGMGRRGGPRMPLMTQS
jgi:protein-L-isoaspartate(D-aspartate) O-methyltransferase